MKETESDRYLTTQTILLPRWVVWVILGVFVLAIATAHGCASLPAFAQNKPATIHTSSIGPCASTWFDRIAGLSVLNWGGGILIALGGIAFVGSFIPAVGALFPKKMALTCLLSGIASVLLFNFITAYAWVIYVALAVVAVLAILAYRVVIWKFVVQVSELVVRKDEDGDGTIGPKFG